MPRCVVRGSLRTRRSDQCRERDRRRAALLQLAQGSPPIMRVLETREARSQISGPRQLSSQSFQTAQEETQPLPASPNRGCSGKSSPTSRSWTGDGGWKTSRSSSETVTESPIRSASSSSELRGESGSWKSWSAAWHRRRAIRARVEDPSPIRGRSQRLDDARRRLYRCLYFTENDSGGRVRMTRRRQELTEGGAGVMAAH
jgi:hypothetical protein